MVAHAGGAEGAEAVLAPFPQAEVWDAVQKGGKQGTAVVGDTLATWARLRAAPWTYVVVGPAEELIGR